MLSPLSLYFPTFNARSSVDKHVCSARDLVWPSMGKKLLTRDVVSFRNKTFPDRVIQTPGNEQKNRNFIDNGSTYCAPVSAYNGLKWLASIGELPPVNDASYEETIKALSIYFKNGSNGTTSKNLCEGLENYFKAKGYSFKEVGYQGYSNVGKYGSKIQVPNLEKLRSLIDQKSIVLLNFGCYEKSKDSSNKDYYKREEGHWVTLVGYDNDNPNLFYIKDPYLTKEENSKGIPINFAKLEDGILDPLEKNDEDRKKRSASGFNEVIEGGLAYYHHDKYRCILDGFVYLSI